MGLENPAAKAAKDEADAGKAVGGACRQSGRAIEDCYLTQDSLATLRGDLRRLARYGRLYARQQAGNHRAATASPGAARIAGAEEEKRRRQPMRQKRNKPAQVTTP